jgi:hypothetical protein
MIIIAYMSIMLKMIRRLKWKMLAMPSANARTMQSTPVLDVQCAISWWPYTCWDCNAAVTYESCTLWCFASTLCHRRWADSPLAVYAWSAWSACLEPIGGLTDLGDSLKLRDLNSSASVILSGNGAQAAQVGGRRMLLVRQRCLVVLRRMRCRSGSNDSGCGI